MKGKIKVNRDGSGKISAGGASDKFERIGANAARQLGVSRGGGKAVTVSTDEAERYSVHGGRLDYD